MIEPLPVELLLSALFGAVKPYESAVAVERDPLVLS